jgi:hypothetical protein
VTRKGFNPLPVQSCPKSKIIVPSWGGTGLKDTIDKIIISQFSILSVIYLSLVDFLIWMTKV